MVPAKEGIQFIVKNRDLRAGLEEQRVKVPVAGAVHEFDGDIEPGFLDDGKLNKFVELLEVIRLRDQWSGI